MSKSYPRKQTLLIFLICIILVTVVAFYVRGTNINKTAITGHISVINNETIAPILTDTDWKKTFFENSTSTVNKAKTLQNAGSNNTEKLTVTDQLGRAFFSQYINLKSTGLTSDSEVVGNAVSGLLTQDYVGLDKPKTYSKSDIKIIQNNDAVALKIYGEAVGSILIKYSPQKDDASIALEGLKKENPNYVKDLNDNLIKYKTIVKLLLNTPVPESVSTYHLGLINGISEISYIASSLKSSETDPMLAISSLSLYQNTFSGLSENVNSIKNALILAGISYNNSENGSYFTSSI